MIRGWIFRWAESIRANRRMKAEFERRRQEQRGRVFNAFGVPPFMVGRSISENPNETIIAETQFRNWLSKAIMEALKKRRNF